MSSGVSFDPSHQNSVLRSTERLETRSNISFFLTHTQILDIGTGQYNNKDAKGTYVSVLNEGSQVRTSESLEVSVASFHHVLTPFRTSQTCLCPGTRPHPLLHPLWEGSTRRASRNPPTRNCGGREGEWGRRRRGLSRLRVGQKKKEEGGVHVEGPGVGVGGV